MPNDTQTMVYSPDGQLGMIPSAQTAQALAQGYKPRDAYIEAVHPKTGQTGIIPREQWSAASAQGYVRSPRQQAWDMAPATRGTEPSAPKPTEGQQVAAGLPGMPRGGIVPPTEPNAAYGGTQYEISPLGTPVPRLTPEIQAKVKQVPQVVSDIRRGALAAGGATLGPALVAEGGSGLLPMILRSLGTGVTAGAGDVAGSLISGQAPNSTDVMKTGGMAAGGEFALGELPVAAGSYAARTYPKWWNRFTGYERALEEAKNANRARYLQTEQQATEGIEAAKQQNIARYQLGEQKAQEAIAQGKSENYARYLAGEQKAEQVVVEAQKEFLSAKSSQPTGLAGEWARTNQAIGAPPRGIRVGQGAADITGAQRIAGRGLVDEGLSADRLLDMTPAEQSRLVGDRWNAAGQAIDSAASDATKTGVKINVLQSATKLLEDSIPNKQVRSRAAELFAQTMKDVGITDPWNVTPEQAVQLRQAMRTFANFSKPGGDLASVPGVGQQLYRGISRDLHEAVPVMKKLDMHYADLKAAVEAIQGQAQKYMAGTWKKPVLSIAKAAEKVPGMPISSPYTPLPGMPTSSPYTPLPGMPNASPYTPLPTSQPYTRAALRKGAGLASAAGLGAGGAVKGYEALQQVLKARKKGN